MRRVKAFIIAGFEADRNAQFPEQSLQHCLGIEEVQLPAVTEPGYGVSGPAEQATEHFRLIGQVGLLWQVNLAQFKKSNAAFFMPPVRDQQCQQIGAQGGPQVLLLRGHGVGQAGGHRFQLLSLRPEFTQHVQAGQRIAQCFLKAIASKGVPYLSLQVEHGCGTMWRYRLAQYGRWDFIITDDAGDLFNEVDLPRNIAAPVGGGGFYLCL